MILDNTHSEVITLNDKLPKLNNIYPKYIDNKFYGNMHFICDINNNFHALALDNSQQKYSITLHDNIYYEPDIDPIMVNIANRNPTCVIKMFTFDEPSNKFTIKTVYVLKFNDPSRHVHSTSTTTVCNIQSYEYVKHDSIILKAFNGDVHVYIYDHHFKVLPKVDHKLYIKDKHIYIIDNDKLYSGFVNDTKTLIKYYQVMTIPKDSFFCYSHFSRISVTLHNNQLIYNDNVTKVDMSRFIACVESYSTMTLIFTNKVFLVAYKKLVELSLDDDIINGNDLITYGITKQFKWCPTNHHYLSNNKRHIINNIIMCNRYTNYQRIPKFVLINIINLFINKKD